MLAALHVLAALGTQSAPLSDLTSSFERYAASGEINSAVSDPSSRTAAVRAAWADRPDVTLDDLDGLTVSGTDWWFNVRPSNTEPLLRLNVEAPTQSAMRALRDEVLATIRT